MFLLLQLRSFCLLPYRIRVNAEEVAVRACNLNKQILKISNKPDEVKRKGGLLHYGFVKNPFVLLKGSVAGPVKRLIRFNVATRPNKHMTKDAPEIKYISL